MALLLLLAVPKKCSLIYAPVFASWRLEKRGNSPARRMTPTYYPVKGDMTIPLANKDQNKLFYKTDVSFRVFKIRLINYDIVIIIIIINEYCSPLSPR